MKKLFNLLRFKRKQFETAEYEKTPPALEVLEALVNNHEHQKTVNEIFSALPYKAPEHITIIDVQNALSKLGFKLEDFGKDDEISQGTIIQLDPSENKFKWHKLLKLDLANAHASLLRIDLDRNLHGSSREERNLNQYTWFSSVIRRFNKTFRTIFIYGVFIQIAALAMPFFLMNLYNRLSDILNMETVISLGIGAALVLVFENFLRRARAEHLSWFAARLDHIVNNSVINHLLHLTPQSLERASIPAQISRLKAFEAVRDFFTSPLFFNILDLVFVPIGLFVLYFIAPSLIWVPFVAAFFYSLVAYFMYGSIRRKMSYSAKIRTELQNHTIELFEKHEFLRMNGVSEIWQDIYEELAKKNAVASYRSFVGSNMLENLTYLVTMFANVTVIFFGVKGYWAGEISGGAIFASILICSRIFNMMHVISGSVSRLKQVQQSIDQLNMLMDIKIEKENNLSLRRLPQIRGDVSFKNVGLRYTKESDPVVVGFNCDIRKGEFVTIAGGNGSGKSTLLKLVLGMYRPQAGEILVDGKDIRQLEPQTFRQQVSYVPQLPQIFRGSIRENLLLAKPNATEAELWYALKQADAVETVKELPHGIETQLSRSLHQVADILHYQVNLARAYLKDSPILLIDELPYAFLNSEIGEKFIQRILDWRGKKTIIMVSHWSAHIKLADRSIGLLKNHHAIVDEPKAVLKRLAMDSIINEEYF